MWPQAIPRDTDIEVMKIQVALWKIMTISERIALINQLHADVERMARAGILAKEPNLTELQIRYELLKRRFGIHIADVAC